MKLFFSTLSLLFLAVSAVHLDEVSRQALVCANKCQYRLCSNPLHPSETIVHPDGSLNVLRGNGIPMDGEFCFRNGAGRPLYNVSLGAREALVSPDGIKRYRKISNYKPKGLFASYPPDYFQVVHDERGLSRIVRRNSQGNQGSKLNGHCVTIPMRFFITAPVDGVATGVISSRACISIMVRAFKLSFELHWDNLG